MEVICIFGIVKVYVSFDVNGCLVDLDKRVGKIGVFFIGVFEIDISC